MAKWEYLQVYTELNNSKLKQFQQKLDDYGQKGWELVSMVPIETKNWIAGDSETSGILSVFKRPLE